MSTIKVDELTGSNLTFEVDINDKPKKKNKSAAFKAGVGEDEDQVKK